MRKGSRESTWSVDGLVGVSDRTAHNHVYCRVLVAQDCGDLKIRVYEILKTALYSMNPFSDEAILQKDRCWKNFWVLENSRKQTSQASEYSLEV